MAVPIATLVHASSRSAGWRLNRAAHVIGMAINPSPGRPPFSRSEFASSRARSGEFRSSWVSSDT